MSRRLRQLSGRDVSATLVRFGFEVVATRGSHCKLRRTLPSGERQTMTIPLHPTLAAGTLLAIYRQVSRFVPEDELQPLFYTGHVSKPAGVGRQVRPAPGKPREKRSRQRSRGSS
jgi:predicted RNA binding protein YcfA (HicA-like mRNA interferase family)